MRLLWQYDGDVKKQAITVKDIHADIFKAKGFVCLGEVDKKGKLVEVKVEKPLAVKKTK